MARKIIIASSGLGFLVCVGLIIFAISATALTIDPAQIESAKQNAIALIDAGNYAQAEPAADNIVSNFSRSPETATALYQIAQKLEQTQQYRQAMKYRQIVVANWPQSENAMWSQMGVAIAGIFLEDYATAQSAADALAANYATHPDVPCALYLIGDRYTFSRKYDEASGVFDRIASAYPLTSWGGKARLAGAKINILLLIEEGSYSLAQQGLDLLIADFNASPDLPDVLYGVAERFGWSRRYVEARNIFDRVIADYPQSSVVENARFYAARMNACALINAGKDAEAVAAIDRFITDHNDNPQLADALYWITQEYEWTKGNVEDRTTRYDTPTTLYGRLMQEFGDSSLGRKAAIDQKRLSHRTKIFTLMGSAEQNDIDTAIAAMVADFNGQPALVSELYWCGREYEEYPAKYPQSKAMYERIIAEFPNSVEANQAEIDIPRLGILELIQGGDINTAEDAIDAFIVDYNSQPHTSACLRRIATEYYMAGMDLKQQGQRDEGNNYFLKAKGVWQRIIDKMPVRAEETDTAYFFAACSLREMGQWEDAIKYYQVVLDDWPDYEHADVAQAAIGWSYEALVHTGKLTKQQANPFIEQAYNAVLENYPDSHAGDYASIKLAEMSIERGDNTAAAGYYRVFLGLASPDNPNIAGVKAKLEKLEGGQ